MNLDRLIIRLAAVNACNNFGEAPYPTIADGRVFDSRIEPVEDFKTDKAIPVIVVYTDYDKDHWFHQQVGEKTRLLTVTFEIMCSLMTEPDPEGVYAIVNPETDAELEASLDIMEVQLWQALAADNVAADCYRSFASAYANIISRRGATVEGGMKTAARQITLELQTPKGPTNGTISPEVDAFLTRLAQTEAYAQVAATARQIYAYGADRSASEQLIRAMGWTTRVAKMLGHERGPAAVPPPGTPSDIEEVEEP